MKNSNYGDVIYFYLFIKRKCEIKRLLIIFFNVFVI